jgi:hypothetical protein
LDGLVVPVTEVFAKLALDGDKAGHGFRTEKLRYALELWIADQRKLVIARLQREVAYQKGTPDREVRRWVRAVTGKEDPVDVAVVKHFIWQVKRKLHGLKVEHHLMAVIKGPQGGGKSSAIAALLAMLGELVDVLSDLSALGDERQAFRQALYFVTFCDEMAKAERVCVDSLKNRITSDVLKWRVLGLNTRAAGTNATTFIGALNGDIRDIIQDVTGMRRFYQIEAVERLDWDSINAINYAELWRSVDHLAEAPIKPVMEQLRVRQEAIRGKDMIEEWLDERCVSGAGWTSSHVLFDAYCAEGAKQRRQLVGIARFGRRMKELVEARVGGEGIGWKNSNGKRYAVRVLPDPNSEGSVEGAMDFAMEAVENGMSVEEAAKLAFPEHMN